MKTTARRTAGTVIFLAGLALGLCMALVPIWANLEAASYFSSGADYAQFRGLHCPILMGRSDTATVTSTFNNPNSKAIQPYYEVEVSGAGETRSLEGQVLIPAYASRTIYWTVDVSDIDLGYFIMNKFDVLPFAGNPAREATCGIMVLDLAGLNGAQIFDWGLVLSLLGLVGGLALREASEGRASSKERSERNGLRAAGIAACLALLTGFMGWWLVGVVFFAITILLLVILLRFTLP